MSVRLPKPVDVSNIVAGLIGKDPGLTLTKVPLKPNPKSPAVFAEFLNTNGEIAVVLVSDVEFASRVGAALAMMPANMADNSIKAGKVEPGLLENYYEIANVLTAAFSVSETRLILRHLFEDPGKLPAAGQAIVKQPGARLDLEANIPGYGKGKLALLAA
jgi:hypothetical protein